LLAVTSQRLRNLAVSAISKHAEAQSVGKVVGANRKEEDPIMKTFGLAIVLVLLLAIPAVAATDENLSIETLLRAGWQIAGYAAANQSAVESALILLRNANESYLVQCRASYDVTRSPSVNSHCYKLR
jgi:hypothetical protein